MRSCSPQKSIWILSGILIAVILVVYGNVYENRFLYDDEFLIEKNTFIRSWDRLSAIFSSSSTAGAGKSDSFYRPIQALFYLITFQIFGLSTFAFHLLNIILHACNSTLVFALGRRLGFGLWGSWMGALLWSVHPIHTEAVTYMSATADPGHALFVLAGLVALIPTFSWPRILTASLLFVLALLSKEAAIVFPALVSVCLYYLSKDPLKIKTYYRTAPFWIIALMYLFARSTVLDFEHSFRFYEQANLYTESVWIRTLTFLATLPAYLELLFFPSGLHIDRHFPVYTSLASFSVCFGFILLVGAMAVVWRSLRRRWLIGAWGVLWVFSAHFPHTGILIPMNSFFLEHWLYLPSVGFFLTFPMGLASLGSPRWRNILLVVCFLCTLILSILTWRQNRIWATPFSLYSHILKFNPGVARIHNNLAMAYSEEGKVEQAIVHYKKAISITDSYPETHHNLGLAYLRLGRLDEGIFHLERAVEINSDFYFSYDFLAQAYAAKGGIARSEYYRKKYLEIRLKFLQR